MVDITLELIECAKENEQKENKKYQYFALLSGQDYAIQNIDAINEELHSHYPEPFIDCTPYDRNNWLFYKFNSNRNILKSVNYIKENMRRGIIRKVCRGSLLVIQKLIGVIHRTDYDLLRKKNIELYGGSAWWILPDKIIDFILDEKEKEYVQDLLSTWTPEETFFQIMAMRSPISNLVHINPPEQVSQSCKTWAYFSDEDKPFCGHPYIFTKTEFSKLVESECWFARKFDFCKDADIFDMLDNYYHN